MQKIGLIPRDKFLEVAEKVMACFLALPGNNDPDRTGGFMAVLDISGDKQPKMLFVNEIGTCRPVSVVKCFEICQEKVRRLHKHAEDGHVSSWQSRNISRREYGGAITASRDGQGIKAGQDIIGSVSGLVEHGDEAVMLVTWMIFRWIMLDEAVAIAAISENPYFKPLLKACNDIFKEFTPIME